MHSTLFYIPDVIPGTGIPVFGVGVLMGVWAVAAIVWAVWLLRAGRIAELKSGVLLVALVGVAIYSSRIIVEPGLGLPIRGYGTLLLVAVVSTVALGHLSRTATRLDVEIIYSLAFWLFVGGMVGAVVLRDPVLGPAVQSAHLAGDAIGDRQVQRRRARRLRLADRRRDRAVRVLPQVSIAGAGDGRSDRAELCARRRLGTARLFDARLLLRRRVRSSVGGDVSLGQSAAGVPGD